MALSQHQTDRLDGAGHADAGELFGACHPALIRWVRWQVRDEEVARDIAAEAFARLISRWSRLDDPRSYLYAIAANLINDHRRKTSRERNTISRAYITRARVFGWQPAQETDLRALIEALPRRLPAKVLLHHCTGFRIREIASMVGKPEGTIKADLHHARPAGGDAYRHVADQGR